MKISKLNKYRLGNFELKPKHIYAKNKLSLIANKLIKKLNLLELKGGSETELRETLTTKLNSLADYTDHTNIKTILDELTAQMNTFVTSGAFHMNDSDKALFNDIIEADKELADMFNMLINILTANPGSFELDEQELLKKNLFNIQKGLFNLQIKIIFRKMTQINSVNKIKFSPILDIINRKITFMNNYIDQAYDNKTPQDGPTIKHEWIDKLQNYLYYKIYKYMINKRINDVTPIDMSGITTVDKYLRDIKDIINEKMTALSFVNLNDENSTSSDLGNITVQEFFDKSEIFTVISKYNDEFLNNKAAFKIDTYAKLSSLLTEPSDDVYSKKQITETDPPETLTNLINTEYNSIKLLIDKEIISKVPTDTTVPTVPTAPTEDDGSPFRSIDKAKKMSIEEYLKTLIPYILTTIGKIAIDELSRLSEPNKETANENSIKYDKYIQLSLEDQGKLNNYIDITVIIDTFFNISGIDKIKNIKSDNTIDINSEKLNLDQFIIKYKISKFVDYFNLRLVTGSGNEFSYFSLQNIIPLINIIDFDVDDPFTSTFNSIWN